MSVTSADSVTPVTILTLVTSPDPGDDPILADIGRDGQQAEVPLRVGVVITETETGGAPHEAAEPAPHLKQEGHCTKPRSQPHT